MVEDWFEGRFALISLWLTHSQHRIPAYKVLFLLDARFFGLNMRLEVMLGTALLALAVFHMLKRFMDAAPEGIPMRRLLLGSALIALLGFSLNQWASLIYGLGALNGFGRIAFFVEFWLLLDICLRREASVFAIIGVCTLLVFTLIAWAGGHGRAYLLASLTTIALVILQTGWGQRQLRWLAISLLVSGVAAECVYWLVGPIPAAQGALSGFLQAVATHPGRAVEYVLMALCNSAIPVAGMEHHGWPHALTLIIGAGIAMIYLQPSSSSCTGGAGDRVACHCF
jgi:hypothetical protein